jgi:F-type H+-transporting ATPase subunit epsilon
MTLEIITAERIVLQEQVDQINAPTRDGRIGILPRHTALMTILDVGELDIIKEGERTAYAIAGGFIEVLPTPREELPTRVTILSDTVERDDEIDESRAEEARLRAEELLRQRHDRDQDVLNAEAELRLAIARLKVAQLRKTRRGGRIE